MQEANQKPHNNSYESGGGASSSSSESSSGTNLFDPHTADIFAKHQMNSRGLADYLVDHNQNQNDSALYNTSVEEGIFPNVSNNSRDIQAPSYVPEFNVNENTPLVYSWFPVVPGFYDESYSNLHNFSHIDGTKLDMSDPEVVVVGAEEGGVRVVEKAEMMVKITTTITNEKNAIVEPAPSTSSAVNFHTLDNSCNAMDLNLTCHEEQKSIVSCDLSFNGKIEKLKESLAEVEVDEEVDTEEERQRNESFEMLKKEDSLQMLIVNEKSPEVRCTDSESAASDSRPDQDHEEHEKTNSLQSSSCSPAFVPEIPLKSPKTRDRLILARLRSANARIVPPPSVTDCTTSLTEMLTAYHRNIDKSSEMFQHIDTNSLFIPSHSSTVGRDFVEWPAVASICALDVTYNRNESAEAIEEERLRFCDRYVGRETASSYDFKISQESAKKHVEKLKLSNPSPNSRLKKYAVRRSQFSLASLKTLQSSSHSHKLQIDTKLLSKRITAPRTSLIGSAKKKTPGKRKTPTSAKRRASLIQPQTRLSSATRSSSKRALFTSPASRPSSSRDLPSRLTTASRPLFLFDDKKRRRSPSPSQDAENQCGKQRRMNSPARLLKSQSFSLLASSTATSSSSLENLRMRDSYQRTQSEMNLAPRVLEVWKPLRYERAWDAEMMSKKVLFNVSTTLKEKNIDKTNKNFKRFGTTLVNLVKRVFKEYYNPRVRSDSEQLKKFASMMVTQVMRGDDKNEILATTKENLRKKMVGSNLLLNEPSSSNRARAASMMSLPQQLSTFPVLNTASSHENSLNSSSSSLNRSSSKNNSETIALRENFQLNRNNSADKSTTSAAIRFRASESNLVRHNSMPANPSVLKAKRQISF